MSNLYGLGSPYRSWQLVARAEEVAGRTGNPSGSASWPERLAEAAASHGVAWDTGFDRITVPDSWTYAQTAEFLDGLLESVPPVIPLDRMVATYRRRAQKLRQQGDHVRARVNDDMALYAQELAARAQA